MIVQERFSLGFFLCVLQASCSALAFNTFDTQGWRVGWRPERCCHKNLAIIFTARAPSRVFSAVLCWCELCLVFSVEVWWRRLCSRRSTEVANTIHRSRRHRLVDESRFFDVFQGLTLLSLVPLPSCLMGDFFLAISSLPFQFAVKSSLALDI